MKKLIFFLLFLFAYGAYAQDTLFVSSNTIELSKAGKRIYKGVNILYVKKNLPSNIQFGNASSFYELIAPAGQLIVSINGAPAVSGMSYSAIYDAIKESLTSLSPGSVSAISGGTWSGSSTVSVFQPTASNLNATVVGTGTLSVQNTSPVIGGNAIAVKTDGSEVIQPISVATLPLPSGAATSTLQTTGNNTLATIAANTSNPPIKLQDGSGANITSTSINSKQRLDVNLASAATVGGTAPNTGDLVGGSDGINFQPLQMDASKNLKVAIQGTPSINSSLQTGSNIVGRVGIDQTTPGLTNKVNIGTDGSVAINSALPTGTNSIGRVVSSPPTSTSGMITSATTAPGGTSFVTFASQACTQLYLANNTGTTIEFQLGGSGSAMPIFNGAYFLVTGITNASSVGIRRVDQSTTTVTVQAHALTN